MGKVVSCVPLLYLQVKTLIYFSQEISQSANVEEPGLIGWMKTYTFSVVSIYIPVLEKSYYQPYIKSSIGFKMLVSISFHSEVKVILFSESSSFYS